MPSFLLQLVKTFGAKYGWHIEAVVVSRVVQKIILKFLGLLATRSPALIIAVGNQKDWAEADHLDDKGDHLLEQK